MLSNIKHLLVDDMSYSSTKYFILIVIFFANLLSVLSNSYSINTYRKFDSETKKKHNTDKIIYIINLLVSLFLMIITGILILLKLL